MCDTFCARTPAGMLFAKSSDRPVDEAQVLRWFPRRADPGGPGAPRPTTHTTVPDRPAAALLGSQPTWMWGLEHGMNEHGVAVGNEKVWTTDDPRAVPPALLGMDLVRLGLERGTSADGALEAMTELLEAHGQGGTGEEGGDEPYWSSFLVVDGSGGWVLETSGRTWVARPVGEGAAISNRLTVATDWTRASADVAPGTDWDRRRDPAVPTAIADHRLAATRGCVAQGADLTPARAVATLRDHGTGPWGAPGHREEVAPPAPPATVGQDWSGITVCMHVRGYQCTTSSLVALLPEAPGGPVRVWASLGTPCTSVLLPVAVATSAGGTGTGSAGTVIPSVLGDVTAWTALSGLSRRAEQPGPEGAEALVAVRAAFDPIEDRAWEAAEALWDADAPTRDWREAAGGWDGAVRAALGDLAGMAS